MSSDLGHWTLSLTHPLNISRREQSEARRWAYFTFENQIRILKQNLYFLYTYN